MDPITPAIITVLGAGALGTVTDASKTALVDGYIKLKELLAHKFGKKSAVVQAVADLETKPESAGRQQTVQEELGAVHAEQDHEVLAAAQRLLTLIQPQQVGQGKFTIQNTGTVQGQTIGDHPTVTQHFGEPPKQQ